MKKILALFIIFVTFALIMKCLGQGVEVSARADLKNRIWGSKVNKPAWNWKIGISDRLPIANLRYGMEYEVFNEIEYQQWTFVKLDYEFKITEKLNILPGFALSQIYHETSYSRDAITAAFNFELTWVLNDFLKLTIQANKEWAADITQKWRESIYTGLIYYWN